MITNKIIYCLVVSLLFNISQAYASQGWSNYPQNPYVIKLDEQQNVISGRGGIIAADLNADGLLDFLVTTQENDYGNEGKAVIVAYDHFGKILWVVSDVDIVLNGHAENYGLPGWHGPGISVADINHDGENGVVHLNTKNGVVIREGKTGKISKIIKVPLPSIYSRIKMSWDTFINETLASGFKKAKKKPFVMLFNKPKRWSHFQIVNIVGQYDDEIILQADPLPFNWLCAVSLSSEKKLWEYNQYQGCNHNGFRAADIDNDGFDEVVGKMIIDHDGTIMNKWIYREHSGHLDSIFIRDVLPEVPGLEWVVLEETHEQDDRTALLSIDKEVFYHSFGGFEPQNAAIGDFDPSRPGLEIWCRSRFNTNQIPWVIDAKGNTIAKYFLNDHKPDEWTNEGIEGIYDIDWDGSQKKYLAAKERHTEGKIAIIDAMTGEFIKWWDENAARIYVCDVAGDYREEIIVINSKEKEIHIYWNNLDNKQDISKNYWDFNWYKRQKINYNYYSP